MIARNRRAIAWLILMTVIVYALLKAAALPLLAQAAPTDLPPRPTPQPTSVLPPRPTPRPVENVRVGALIELQVQFSQAWPWTTTPWQELYTMVQWQDGWGNWHDVEGWQGTLDEIVNGVGVKLWWVAEPDLGTGPFRWAIYKSYDNQTKILAKSEPFYLPNASRQILTIEVPLAP